MTPSSPTGSAYLRSVSLRLLWYGFAVMLSVLALLLMMLLRPLLESSIFLLFLAAVAVSALYGGLGPGLVATMLSALASDFFFLSPLNALLGGIEETLRLGIFVAVGLIISWLCEMHKRTDERLRMLNENLERQVADGRALQRQLEHKASHDHLTDLPNRTMFYEHLERALVRAQRQGSKVALLLMDLDDFKIINDSFGHRTGDKVLVEVAGRLKGFLRGADICARLGGDEFTVLLEDVARASDALRVAERYQAQLRVPLSVDEQRLYTSASIGIAVGAEEQPEELVHAADLAMYQAKSRGKARSVLFDPEAKGDAAT
ncbi:MAG TPA: diguanylate cyclase [Rubrobacteraceae bacterium]|nr:diguanylate cyclase [Rubrobacteraceae bacterium]